MDSRQNDLGDARDILLEAEFALTALKGMGYHREVYELMNQIFPKPLIKKPTPDQTQAAIGLGKQEFYAGTRFLDWDKQPIGMQPYWRKGWLTAAHECSAAFNIILNDASDHQYWLEAARLMIRTEAAHTKVKSCRVHWQKIIKGVERTISALQCITGEEEIRETTETKEGLGSVAS